MAKINRKATYEDKELALRNGKTFSFAEIEDVVELIATKQYPDIKFGDDECELWSRIRKRLGIYY